jgi:DNA-binding CsgD family transcriptional regulator/tetratricopeptide (TPR) repeat protein
MVLCVRALGEARRQHGQVVLVSGEAGIGKTRLVEELTAVPALRSATVLWGRCRQGEMSPAYWPWTQILDSLAERTTVAALRRLVGPTARRLGLIAPLVAERLGVATAASATTDRFHLISAVQALLRRVSHQSLVLVVLEDLQWADQNSLLLLESIAQDLRGCRILIVATYRDDEIRPRLAQALAELARLGVIRIPMCGLAATDTGALIAEISGRQPPAELVARIHARTGGNPFFVTEVARLESADPRAIPENVRAAIVQRLDRLSADARTMLEVAAVVGREFELRVVGAALPDGAREMDSGSLTEILQATIVGPMPGHGHDSYHFKHELIRDAIYEGISPPRREHWHAAVLHAIERLDEQLAGDRAAELAAHAARAEALVGPATVVKYSLLAGEQKLAAHAFEDALPHFERAWRARNPVPLDAEAASILAGLGCAQAATTLRWSRQDGWAHLRRAVGYYLHAGDIQRAVDAATHPAIVPEAAADVSTVIEPMLAAVPSDSIEEGWLRARLGAALYFETGLRSRARAAFDRAHQLATMHGDRRLELRTLAYETSVDHFDLKWPDVLTKSRRVIALARRIEDLHSEAYARYRAAFALVHAGHANDARRDVEATLAAAERLRDRGLLADALSIAAWLAQSTGAWNDARAYSNRGLTLAPRHLPLLYGRVMMEFETGTEAQGREYLRQLLDADRPGGPYPLARVFSAIALAQTTRFDRDAAIDDALAAINSVLERPAPLPNAVVSVRMARALLCLRDPRAGDLEAELEFLSPLEPRIPTNWCIVLGRLLGRLARAAGQHRVAAARFGSALAFCRRSGYRPELAWTCYDYATALLDSHERADRLKAAALMEEAGQAAAELHMAPLAALVTEFRKRFRVRLERRPAGLTGRELETLRLVAAGQTNKEIAQTLSISTNTVANHVARVIAKTGASNRTGAAAYAARHDLFVPVEVGVTPPATPEK